MLNVIFAMTILDLASRVHDVSFVIVLPGWLKESTFSSSFLSIIFCIRDDCFETPPLP